MSVRDTIVGNAASANARPWATGPAAVYVGFPPVGYQADRPPRTNPNSAAVSPGAANLTSATYQGLYSGDLSASPYSVLSGYGTVVFFGWSERLVAVRQKAVWKPYRTDRAGVEPEDDFYGGRSATVSADFTVWNEQAYQAMQAYTGDFYAGQDQPGAVGRWANAEGASFVLYLVWPYQSKNQYVGFMPAGIRFPAALLDDDATYNGSTARKLRAFWRCRRLFSASDQTFTLFDFDVSATAGVAAKTPAFQP